MVSTTGATTGAITSGGVCAGVVSDPTTIAACASVGAIVGCLLYTSPSPRDRISSRMPSSA